MVIVDGNRGQTGTLDQVKKSVSISVMEKFFLFCISKICDGMNPHNKSPFRTPFFSEMDAHFYKKCFFSDSIDRNI